MIARTGIKASDLAAYVGHRVDTTWCDGWEDYDIYGILISCDPDVEGRGFWLETCEDPTDCDVCPSVPVGQLEHGGYLLQANHLVQVTI